MNTSATTAVIEMQGITTQFGSQVVHKNLNLTVNRGEILGIAGGSGSGKSVLLREMILLQKPTAGSVLLFGQDTAKLSAEAAQRLRQRWGVMFQKGGLFGALSVRDNVGLPLREFFAQNAGLDKGKNKGKGEGRAKVSGQGMSDALIDSLADWKLNLTGLPPGTGLKRPDSLSGGMLKRAAMARALSLDPELLFLDEPTSGLDPSSSSGICDLILRTRELFDPTIVIVSHDIDLLWRVCDRVAILGESRVLAVGPMSELAKHPHPIVKSYFVARNGPITTEVAETAAAATTAAAGVA